MPGSFYEFTTQILFPTVIFLVTFGMGLALTPRAFLDISKRPKVVLTGLAGQLILLPAVVFFFTMALNVPAPIAMGLILIAACPGGSSSNAIVFAIRGELALSVTLTAISSLCLLVTLPFWVKLGLLSYTPEDREVIVSAMEIVKRLLMVMATPIALGMLIRHFRTDFAIRLHTPMRRLSLFLLLMIISVSIYNVRDFLTAAIYPIMLYSLAVASILIASAYLLPRFLSFRKGERLALAIEIGVQNTVLAIFVGASVLGWDELTVTAIVYGLINYALIAGLIYLVKRQPQPLVVPAK
ncbi:MAG: hypothetical protein RQ826_07390 [Xanthomonadales bacterium]|nr:hypothetical protein [Xanthomonadales bacterium]